MSQAISFKRFRWCEYLLPWSIVLSHQEGHQSKSGAAETVIDRLKTRGWNEMERPRTTANIHRQIRTEVFRLCHSSGGQRSIQRDRQARARSASGSWGSWFGGSSSSPKKSCWEQSLATPRSSPVRSKTPSFQYLEGGVLKTESVVFSFYWNRKTVT